MRFGFWKGPPDFYVIRYPRPPMPKNKAARTIRRPMDKYDESVRGRLLLGLCGDEKGEKS